MFFNNSNNFMGEWSNQAPEGNIDFNEPMEMDWSDNDLTLGFLPTDFRFHQNSCPPGFQNSYQPSGSWEYSGVISQAPMPTTPIRTTLNVNTNQLPTPMSSPLSYDWEEYSYSGSHTPQAPDASFSHLPTPSGSQSCNFGDPTSSFDFAYRSSSMTPSYHFDNAPVDPFFNINSNSEHLNSGCPPPFSFLNPFQLQLPTRPAQSMDMGQESSQLAPATANIPALSASHKDRAIVEQSPSPLGQSGRFTAINDKPPLRSLVEVTSAGRDRRKTKRKRVEEATDPSNSSQRPLSVKATRSPPQQVKSPSPSPAAVSVESPETSHQAAPSPRSDDSNNTARSPMSSQESVTEESEPETPTGNEANPAPKRRKLSRTPTTPTTPVATGRRAPRSGGRARASASGSPRSRASPPRSKPGRLSTQEMTTGRYTEAELGLLTEAVHTWRDDNNLTQVAMNDLVNSNARTNDFPGGLWDFICGALPHRERHSVQKAVKRKFNNRKRGTWTPEDDEELCDLYKLYKNQWQRIGEENNRGAEASRDRWRNYCKNGKAQQSGEWTTAEEKRLAHLMRDSVQILVNQRLKDIQAGKSVPKVFKPAELLDFGILSEKMGGTRSRLQCRNKWEKFKSRKSPNKEFIEEPIEFLNGLEFEATTKEAGRKSKAKSRKSSARMSEESEALHNYNEKMLIGDKYTILLGIQRALEKMPEDTDEDEIPWDEIIERDNDTTWSILDRKTVLHQVKILYPAPDDQTCCEVVGGIVEFLEADYNDDEREQFYVDRPRSTRKQRTYTKKGSRARNSISAIKVSEEDDDDSPARSLPTPGSMNDDDDEDGV